MELLVIVVIAFLIGKMFGGKKRRRDVWPDEPVPSPPPRKRKGCLARLVSFLFWSILLFFVSVFSSIALDSLSAPSPVNADYAKSPPSPVSASVAPAVEPTSAPTANPTAEPSTLQEWAEVVAQAEFGKFDSPYTDLISVECEQVDGESAPMIIINAKYPSSFVRNSDERMSGFLFNVMNVTWKLDELAKAGKIEYGSVFIHGRTTFADKYGNETEGDAAQIRIKASEAAKVNWSYSTVTGDMMPGISVSFGIHPIIRDGLSSGYYNKIIK